MSEIKYYLMHFYCKLYRKGLLYAVAFLLLLVSGESSLDNVADLRKRLLRLQSAWRLENKFTSGMKEESIQIREESIQISNRPDSCSCVKNCSVSQTLSGTR